MCAQLKGVLFTLPCSQLLPLKVLQTSVTHCAADCLYKVVSDRFHLHGLFYCVCQWRRKHGSVRLRASHVFGGYCSAVFQRTTHWSPLPWATAGIGIIANEERTPQETVVFICIHLPLNWSKSVCFLTARVGNSQERMCVCARVFPSQYRRRAGQLTSAEVPTPHPKP